MTAASEAGNRPEAAAKPQSGSPDPDFTGKRGHARRSRNGRGLASMPQGLPNKAHLAVCNSPKSPHLKPCAGFCRGPQKGSPSRPGESGGTGPKKLTPPWAPPPRPDRGCAPTKLTFMQGFKPSHCPKQLTPGGQQVEPAKPRCAQHTVRDDAHRFRHLGPGVTAGGHIHSPHGPRRLTFNVSRTHIHSPQAPKRLTPSPRTAHLRG